MYANVFAGSHLGSSPKLGEVAAQRADGGVCPVTT